MKKTIEFEGYLSGDGECFAFKVTKDQYIKIIGIERYNEEISIIKEVNKDYINSGFSDEDLKSLLADEDPQEFLIYPSDLFYPDKVFPLDNYCKKHIISLTYEPIEKE